MTTRVRTARRTPQQKLQIVEQVLQMRRNGYSWRDCAKRFEVCTETLRRWINHQPPRAIVPVVVTSEATPKLSQLHIITPDGFRIEGVDTNNIAHVLEALR